MGHRNGLLARETWRRKRGRDYSCGIRPQASCAHLGVLEPSIFGWTGGARWRMSLGARDGGSSRAGHTNLADTCARRAGSNRPREAVGPGRLGQKWRWIAALYRGDSALWRILRIERWRRRGLGGARNENENVPIGIRAFAGLEASLKIRPPTSQATMDPGEDTVPGTVRVVRRGLGHGTDADQRGGGYSARPQPISAPPTAAQSRPAAVVHAGTWSRRPNRGEVVDALISVPQQNE
ncbi:hypothetical protein PybrP1_012450 [[Pythium] brassicae (nom. inval.)]|nr:hypothetical protein PybrP1_012450 [[Pythium] brassicae (nom. inval.)]